MEKNQIHKYSWREEIANSVTHGLGVAFGVIALVMMILKSIGTEHSSIKVASVSIYGGAIIFLFLASTLYHAFTHTKTKAIFKMIDHCAIYILIAGSYTPFLLVTFEGGLSWTLMIIVWSLAVLGVVFKLIFLNRFKKVSIASYLGMGWLSVLILYELSKTLPREALYLMGLGGVVYSLGVLFYIADKKIPFNHAFWHLFVVGGCVLHFLTVYFYVI